MRWDKKSGTLWHVPQCTIWYMKGIPKSHGTAVGNAGQPSLSFCDFIFMDSDPIAIVNDVNIVLRIKIFAGRDKSAKTAKILPCETF